MSLCWNPPPNTFFFFFPLRCMKAPSCCWVPVCPVMAVCQRRRAWRSLSRAWRKWTGFWRSTRCNAQPSFLWKLRKSGRCLVWHFWAVPYIVPIVSLSLSEVRRVETQGAGSVDMSTVSAFLRRQVRCGHHRGCPQALWLPQEFRWASGIRISLLTKIL